MFFSIAVRVCYCKYLSRFSEGVLGWDCSGHELGMTYAGVGYEASCSSLRCSYIEDPIQGVLLFSILLLRRPELVCFVQSWVLVSLVLSKCSLLFC